MAGTEQPFRQDAGSLALTIGCALAVVAYDPSAPAADFKRVLGLVVGIAACGWQLASWKRQANHVTAGLVAWIGFAMLSGLSLAWGRTQGQNDLACWVACGCVGVAALGIDGKQRERAVVEAAFAAGSVASMVAIVQVVAGARGLLVHGGQGNGNWLGLLLAITIPLSVGLLQERRRPRDRAWPALAALVAVQGAALALSQSRTAWVALAAAGLGWRCRRASLQRSTVALAIGCASLLLVASLRQPAATSSQTHAETPSIPSSAATSFDGRLRIWRASADAAAEYLPWGAGLGSFAHVYLAAQGKRLAQVAPAEASRTFENATTAHNDWLQACVESGLLAPLLLAAALVSAAEGMRRSGFFHGFSATIALAVCAAADSPWRQPGVALLAGLLLASGAWTIRLRVPRAALLVAAIACAALLLARSTETWVAARLETQAREAPVERRMALLKRAVAAAPASGEALLELGIAHQELGDPRGALPLLQTSREMLANVGTDVAIGNAHLALGDAISAAADFERAVHLHPGGFRARVNLAEALRHLGRLEEAFGQLRVAKTLYPGHPKLRELQLRLENDRIERDVAR